MNPEEIGFSGPVPINNFRRMVREGSTYQVCTAKLSSRCVFVYIPWLKPTFFDNIGEVCTRIVRSRAVFVYISGMYTPEDGVRGILLRKYLPEDW